MSSFDNEVRMSLLWEAFQKADEDEMKEIIHERAHNSRLHKLLKTKNIQRLELKEDVVEKLTMPDTVMSSSLTIFTNFKSTNFFLEIFVFFLFENTFAAHWKEMVKKDSA